MSDSEAEFKATLGLDPKETYLELEVLQIMAQADYPTCVAFAFFWTGMIVTRKNRHLFSAEDLQEWCTALTEYRKYDPDHKEDPIILRLLTERLCVRFPIMPHTNASQSLSKRAVQELLSEFNRATRNSPSCS
jgi:hypothetical protein